MNPIDLVQDKIGTKDPVLGAHTGFDPYAS